MKELSIEEKARAYDEAIKRGLDYIRQTPATEMVTRQSILEHIFPELKESEDKRIRQLLIRFVTYDMSDNYSDDFTPADCVAWLEKQGEQKPALSEEDEKTINNICHIIRQYDKISKRENQPCWYVGDCLLWMQNIKDRVQPQPKQEWSEEDEEMRKRAICACNFTIDKTDRDGFSKHYQEARDWLRSLPIGFITNPNYNEDMIKLLISELQQIADNNKAPKQYAKEIEWLKSLRPHNTWKPSDTEINILQGVIDGSFKPENVKVTLGNILEQLKKLKGE